MLEVDVAAAAKVSLLRLSTFVSDVVSKRRPGDDHSDHRRRIPPTVVMKMDIEGGGELRTYKYTQPIMGHTDGYATWW